MIIECPHCLKNFSIAVTGRIKKTLAERFEKKVEQGSATACHLWKGAKTPRGYGLIRVEDKLVGAHRVAYLLAYGEFEPSLVIHHTCDNKSCVNPLHLKAVGQGVNLREHKEREARLRAGVLRGKPLSEAQKLYTRVAKLRGKSDAELAFRFGTSTDQIKIIK